jgi:hypothetical protein
LELRPFIISLDSSTKPSYPGAYSLPVATSMRLIVHLQQVRRIRPCLKELPIQDSNVLASAMLLP